MNDFKNFCAQQGNPSTQLGSEHERNAESATWAPCMHNEVNDLRHRFSTITSQKQPPVTNHPPVTPTAPITNHKLPQVITKQPLPTNKPQTTNQITNSPPHQHQPQTTNHQQPHHITNHKSKATTHQQLHQSPGFLTKASAKASMTRCTGSASNLDMRMALAKKERMADLREQAQRYRAGCIKKAAVLLKQNVRAVDKRAFEHVVCH